MPRDIGIHVITQILELVQFKNKLKIKNKFNSGIWSKKYFFQGSLDPCKTDIRYTPEFSGYSPAYGWMQNDSSHILIKWHLILTWRDSFQLLDDPEFLSTLCAMCAQHWLVLIMTSRKMGAKYMKYCWT